MTKRLFFLFLSLTVFLTQIQSQATFGDQQIINLDADGVCMIYCADIDNDGDQDVISASYNDSKIAWYENTDGNGLFGAQQIITSDISNATSVYYADIDGDEDIDILSSSTNDNKIAWYENTDGNGTFGSQQVITHSALGANAVYSADLDGDGDMDVLSASDGDNKIAWYENTDGNGTFGIPIIISTDVQVAISVYASDLDGDSDIDVLSVSYSDSKIAWYENLDGEGNFGTQQVINIDDGDGAYSVYSADFDGDGDMDVLSGFYSDNKVAWYENMDGEGTFGTQQVISTNANGINSVYSADLDGDGDMDVLSASRNDDKIAWYENTDSNGTFGDQQIISLNADGAGSVRCADIDLDGDMDVLSGSGWDNKIAWYENLLETNVTNNQQNNISIYPNPINNLLTINNEKFIINSITISNIMGEILFQSVYGTDSIISNKINLSEYESGIYFVNIKTENQIITKKIIKK